MDLIGFKFEYTHPLTDETTMYEIVDSGWTRREGPVFMTEYKGPSGQPVERRFEEDKLLKILKIVDTPDETNVTTAITNGVGHVKIED